MNQQIHRNEHFFFLIEIPLTQPERQTAKRNLSQRIQPDQTNQATNTTV